MNRAERFSIQVWFHRGHEVLDRSLGHEVLDRAFPGPPRPIMAHHGPSRPLMAPGPRMAPGLPARVPMGARGCEKLKGGPGPAASGSRGHTRSLGARFGHSSFRQTAPEPRGPGLGPGMAWRPGALAQGPGRARRGRGPRWPEAEGPSAARPAARDQLGPGPARNQTGAFTRQLSEDAVQADVEGSWTKAQNSVFRIAKFTAHFNNLAIRSQNTWVTIS